MFVPLPLKFMPHTLTHTELSATCCNNRLLIFVNPLGTRNHRAFRVDLNLQFSILAWQSPAITTTTTRTATTIDNFSLIFALSALKLAPPPSQCKLSSLFAPRDRLFPLEVVVTSLERLVHASSELRSIWKYLWSVSATKGAFNANVLLADALERWVKTREAFRDSTASTLRHIPVCQIVLFKLRWFWRRFLSGIEHNSDANESIFALHLTELVEHIPT